VSDPRTRPLSRVKPAAIFSTVAVGAVAASVGATPAWSAPDYPSWSEVENAKRSEASKQSEIANIEQLLGGLRAASAAAIQQSQIAGEAYRIAQDELAAAQVREDSLDKQASTAAAKAETSRMRAGLLAAHLARNGGENLSLRLFLDSDNAADLLSELGSATRMGEQTDTIYRQALQDRNAADSLKDQASAAKKERSRLADEAKAAYETAKDAADAARAAVAEQETRSATLYAQLATLKETTAEAEREYAEGVRVAEERAAAEAAAQEASQGGGGSGGGGGGEPAPSPGGGGDGGGSPAPNPGGGGGAGAPSAGAVETAIGFAYAQLGEPYDLGGMGPDRWDCSGLTKAAYASAGIYIGTHSATNQFYTLRDQGKAVPVGQAQRGDLLFWGSGGGYYHVAIYLGGGRILEAPNETQPVRDYYIWGSPSAAARPSG
jgi:peptidoglycan DL-endopeptidase CwlO